MAHNIALTADALWRIALVGVIFGAGLPTLFAVGVRALAYGQGDAGPVGDGSRTATHPVGRLVAFACFAVVVAAVALGILFIVTSGFGKVVSFEHVYPVIADKK